jgi:hypothetical protein
MLISDSKQYVDDGLVYHIACAINIAKQVPSRFNLTYCIY